jgi:hypothetical protein
VPVPAAVGAGDAPGGGELDAFLAMIASGRPVRRLRPARERSPTLREAADAFLAQPDLAASSYHSCAQPLGRLGRDLGPERPLEWISGRELELAVVGGVGSLGAGDMESPRGHRAFVLGLLRAPGWVAERCAEVLQRRREPADRTRAIPFAQLERLSRRDDVAGRETALWRPT